MRKYWEFFKICLRSESAYKADYVVDIASNMVFFFIYLALWGTIYRARGVDEIGTYTLINTITYYLITSFIFRFDVAGTVYLNSSIWEGWLTNHLVQPWSAKLITIAEAISNLAIELLLYIPFWCFMLIVSWDYIKLPDLQHFLMFLVTLVLTYFMNMAFILIWNSLAFYFGDQDPNIGFIAHIAVFLGGGIFPLTFLPEKIHRFVLHLPFHFIFDYPANIFLGKVSLGDAALSWVEIIGWTLLFYLIFHLLYRNGLKHYTGVGR